jgi:hypothetical protein
LIFLPASALFSHCIISCFFEFPASFHWTPMPPAFSIAYGHFAILNLYPSCLISPFPQLQQCSVCDPAN